jgi:thiamine-monophosphate kinase
VSMGLTIADIGEQGLIERIQPFCAAGSIGDDAALLDLAPGHRLVVTSDMLIEAVHFSDRTTPPFAVGWRAVAANLSDLAAMGAVPLAVTVALGLPGSTAWAWLEDLYRGMAACLRSHGGAIVGGDFSRAAQRTVSITALGQVRPAEAIYRHTATPGMSIVVTGPHGASRAGLAVLQAEIQLDPADPAQVAAAQSWIKAHQQPLPRFDVIAQLRQLIELNSSPVAMAGMDSSDGLANALLQIAHSSQVGMDIVRSRIPLPPHLSATVGSDRAMDWALYGGEDFELVLCVPHELAARLSQQGMVSTIGTTHASSRVQLVEGKKRTPLSHESFRHF